MFETSTVTQIFLFLFFFVHPAKCSWHFIYNDVLLVLPSCHKKYTCNIWVLAAQCQVSSIPQCRLLQTRLRLDINYLKIDFPHLSYCAGLKIFCLEQGIVVSLKNNNKKKEERRRNKTLSKLSMFLSKSVKCSRRFDQTDKKINICTVVIERREMKSNPLLRLKEV